ncbi:hypothetical protein V6N11_044534, partial [Hibiscus sabdariffa]
MTLMNQNRTNQQASSLIGKILSVKGRNQSNKEIEVGFGSSEGQYDLPLQPLLSRGESTKAVTANLSFRVFVATWNVGGKSPDSKLNLDDILQVHEESDIYVLGEIVPLNAGNVLVIEDNEPAVKWLALINQSLNKANCVPLRGSKSIASPRGSLVFPKTSLRKASKALRTENKCRLKSCNCPTDLERKNSKEFCFRCPQSQTNENDISSEDDEDTSSNFAVGTMPTPGANSMKYSLVASKQMVGIFLTVWMRKELIQHVSHMRISCVGRGILGCLGNKGCISVSMLFPQDELLFLVQSFGFWRERREKAWDSLYNNDQLKIEREAGRTFMLEKQLKLKAKGELQLGVIEYYGMEAEYISFRMNGRSRGFPIIVRFVLHFG